MKKEAHIPTTEESQTAFNHAKDLMIIPQVLQMLMANDKFRLESSTVQFQQAQWVLIGYHSKKLPQAVQK